jgi:hypothetical protein
VTERLMRARARNASNGTAPRLVDYAVPADDAAETTADFTFCRLGAIVVYDPAARLAGDAGVTPDHHVAAGAGSQSAPPGDATRSFWPVKINAPGTRCGRLAY